MKTLRWTFALLFVLVTTATFAQIGGYNSTVTPTNSAPPCDSFDLNGVPMLGGSSYNCTDFFGMGNWANSPLPSSPITGYAVIAGGSGYVNPQVVISDPAGNNATATAVPTNGVITAVNGVTQGSGYVVPQVTIVDVGANGTLDVPTCGVTGQPDCGAGAMVTAVLGGPYQGGMRKFVDPLPDLKTYLATPDVAKFPGSDYYEVALVQYTEQMHSDLPAPTALRGYYQVPSGSSNADACAAAATAAQSQGVHYLGPVILAAKNRPVRVKFTNCLAPGTGGNLFIPTDTTYMGAGMGVDANGNSGMYTQNRATLHLHGGATPWISDGTPHQWTAPAGETKLNKGLSVAYVPDMWFDTTGTLVPQGTLNATNNPGDGSLTFYWTNEQGGRLMFYHDHAYGLTRLNVYAGEAAGYLLVDPDEEQKLAAAGVPGTVTNLSNLAANDLAHLIPLVIQDKTFVPSPAQISAQDPTWGPNFGTTPPSVHAGDLWFPHVYLPNQNPADPGGGNAFGRWDYGPWFHPPLTTLTASTSLTFPCTSSALPGQTLQSTPQCPTCGCPITPNPSGTPEGFMDTPVVNGKAYPVLHVAPEAYRFRILSAGNDRSFNLSWFQADATNTEVAMLPATIPPGNSGLPLCSQINPVAVPALGIGLATALLDASGNPINGTGLPANCWPNYGSVQGVSAVQTMWPADGRPGGVPDPSKAGPAWIQIGSEGGLLPAPVIIPPNAVNFELNTRSITITSVGIHGLWLGPAERADVIVDFSKFAGKTLILYNDAPAPAPAFDSRNDYFTGDGDQTPIGGAPNTPPGYGPNTRTVMQVVVDPNPTGTQTTPLNMQALNAAFSSTAGVQGLFASTQPTTIVPQAVYNSAYAQVFPDTLMDIHATNLSFAPIAPLTFDAPCAPGTVQPPVQCGILDRKTIQELFTLDFGRMNATLGTELQLTNFTTQTTLPFGYAEWPTEITQGGQTALWRITHNGVDTHFIHFHLFNVQVVNRVGWDGSMRPIDPNEAGWKDTVRMNPLEDVLVALQPITPTIPFPLPDSIRPLDVTKAVGADDADVRGGTMSGIDPNTANAITKAGGTTNALINFGWEYVWHCHILGHEENDMMRPIIHQVAPAAPSNLLATPGTNGTLLTWTDNSASEDSFTIEGSSDSSFATLTFNVTIGAAQSTGFSTLSFGQTVSYTDTTTPSLFYRVRANDSFTPQSPLAAPRVNSVDANFLPPPLSSPWSNTAQAVASAQSVTFTGAPATAVYNSAFIVTATTNAAVAPTITGNAVCSVGTVSGTSPATATVTMNSGTGVCTLTAVWAATGTFASATSTQITTAAPATPTTSLTGVPSTGSALYNTTFTLSAGTNASTTPTFTGTPNICTVAPTSGTSTTVTMISGTGVCKVTANWPADSNYTAASQTVSTNAGKLATTTTLAANPNPSSSTQLVTFTFTVAPPAPLSIGAAGPTGTVSVSQGTTVLCTGAVVNGTGTCSYAFVPTGTFPIDASYKGDRNFSVSGTTASLSQQVGNKPTVTLSAPTPVVYNTTFDAVATTDSGVAANITVSGVCSLSGAPVSVIAVGPSLSTTTQTVLMTSGTGNCTVSASWPANIGANFGPAGPVTAAVTAALATPSATLNVPVTTAAYSSSFNVTASTNASTIPSIAGSGGCTSGPASGTSSSTSATITMTSGSTLCTLTANWAPDTNYASANATANVTATQLLTTIAITGQPNPSQTGTAVLVTATLTPIGLFVGSAGPTGTITVSDTLGDTCSMTLPATSCSLTPMQAGDTTLTATYSGDPNFTGSLSPGVTQQVRNLPAVTLTAPSSSAIYNTTFTVTATTTATDLTGPAAITASGGCSIGAATGTAPTTAQVTMTSGTVACALTASWPQTLTYLQATATASVTAVKATPTVSFTTAPPPTAFYSASFPVVATTSNLATPVISVTAGGGCTIAGSNAVTGFNATVTMTSGTNACIVSADLAADSNYNAASTGPVTVAASKVSTTTAITNTPSTSSAGQPVTVNMTVTPAVPPFASSAGLPLPTGTVSFTVSTGETFAPASIVNGSGTAQLTFTTAGPRTITATYNGDANFSASAPSLAVTQQVVDFSLAFRAPTAQSVNGNQRASYTATVTSLNNFTGTVNLTCGGTYPSSFSCSVAPTSFTLAPGGSRNVTLTVNTVRGKPGTYNVGVTATYTGVPPLATIVHSGTVTLTTLN